MDKTLTHLCVALFLTMPLGSIGHIEDYHDDEIISLPELPREPTFKQYSGYLVASETRRLHYWLVESERSPSTDPVVLWLNGGPGCSSINGFFTENGPFLVSLDGKSLSYNNYAWNKISNVLFLESPAGVGYSYATDGIYKTGDDQTADDSYRALVYFFKKFPHYKNREFIITGESYAGAYIPTLLERFHNQTEINLKGALIGNGMITGYFHTFSTDMFYWHSHALISESTFGELLDKCCGGRGTEEDCQFLPPKSTECVSLVLETIQTIYGLNINRYNIYAPCIVPETTRTLQASKRWTVSYLEMIIKQMKGDNTTESLENLVRIYAQPDDSAFVPCVPGDGTVYYMRRPDVQKATHIIPAHITGLPPWDGCSSIVDDNTGSYVYDYTDMLDVLSRVVSDKKHYDILLYYGDTDFVCSFITGRYAFHKVAERAKLQEYSPHQPWYYESSNTGSKQIGGYWERYENLMYLTFRGSGHMVPTDLPAQSLDILNRYIEGTLFGKK